MHRRKFRSMLWQGLKENWWLEPKDPEADYYDETDPRPYWQQYAVHVSSDIDKISGVSEYAKGTPQNPHIIETTTLAYADWSDDHHRLSSDTLKRNGSFATVDDEDIEHLPV